MMMSVYAIRDKKSGFLTPTVEMNDAVAIRNFSHAVMANPSSLFQSFSADYDFYRIGEYETDTGMITSITPIEFLCSADSVVFASSQKKGDDK